MGGGADRSEADVAPAAEQREGVGLVDEGGAMAAADKLPSKHQQRIEVTRQRRRDEGEVSQIALPKAFTTKAAF
jgi:hypothetical protein